MSKKLVSAEDQQFLCIAEDRLCGNIAMQGGFTCEAHAYFMGPVELPFRVLLRFHFAPKSAIGKAIISELVESGVSLVERSVARQEELEFRRMFSQGVKIFGKDDLCGDIVAISVPGELETAGYNLKEIHVLSLDEIFEEREAWQKMGGRTVVMCYEYNPGVPLLPTTCRLDVPEVAHLLFKEPFLFCRVWVNLTDGMGTRVHAAEFTGFQMEKQPRLRLRFANSIWGVEDIPAPEQEEVTIETS